MSKKINENTENIEFPNQRIVDVNMEKEVKNSFINYAMSVIVSRALPDVRDGLKPVHRRILYAMYEDHLTYDKPFCKSATTVGNVLGRYHPHGDAAVYDAMVRLAQDFSMRYPLVEGHGNFGNIDGDGAAAYRYTEARLGRLADEMMTDIEKDVVEFTPNFDNKRKEPTVLPSRFPNFIVNGSVGIAVGMATNVPPHNLGEVVDGVIYLMDNPEASIPDLMQFIKGPDFPTGALICGSNGIMEAYLTGRGRLIVRSRCEVDEEKRRIIVTEIPYQVNKAMLVEAMADCVKDKKIEGISDIRDETGKDGMKIVIEYKREANGQVILNQLYKYTQLQDTFAVNMLCIVDGVPRILNLKEVLCEYIKHQEEVVTRRVKYDLEKALAEMHILEGYKIAIDNIDEVIEIIKKSESIPNAKERLMERFMLSEAQAQAIVEMTLGKLSGLERTKIEDRLEKLTVLVKELEAILADEGKIKEIIKEDLIRIKNRFGDERRTELIPLENEIMLEDLIERHTCVVTMSHSGYIKRSNQNEFTVQRRGGKGVIGMTTKDEDFVERIMVVDTHAEIMFFTNFGKVHNLKAFRIPEAGRTAKGTHINNLLEMADGEKVTAMLSPVRENEEEYLFFVTKNGVVKKTPISEFDYRRKGGKIALILDEGDELVFVRKTVYGDKILIATHGGNINCFKEKDARAMGRSARGIRGIKLEEGDYVIGVAIADEEKYLATITENGFGKRSKFSDFAPRARGGKGVTGHSLSEKTGALAGILVVSEDDDIMLVTDDGTIIRTYAKDLPIYSRTASGVITMRTSKESKIVTVASLENNEEERKLQDSNYNETEEVKTDEAVNGEETAEIEEDTEPDETEETEE